MLKLSKKDEEVKEESMGDGLNDGKLKNYNDSEI